MEKMMLEALREAWKAYLIAEVPIGAIVVKDGVIVGRGHNLRESSKDPTAHAEMIALRDAANTLGGWRLTGCIMYVTIEPCPMCAGAIYQARLDKLVYGAPDVKAGAVHSLYNILQDDRLNHQVDVVSDVLVNECSEIMQSFFKELRNRK